MSQSNNVNDTRESANNRIDRTFLKKSRRSQWNNKRRNRSI